MSGRVSYRAVDGVAWISLGDGSGGNSIDLGFVEALGAAVRAARADDSHVVVLHAGGRVFSVGGDLATFGAAADPGQLVDDLADALHRVVSELHRMDAVVVAAVQGTAAGAGLALAAAADLVVAARTARFALAYTAVGLSPDGGSSLLPASIGLHRALRVALLNPAVTADEAQQIGLVAEVHPAETFEESVRALVARIRSGSRSAQVAAKRLMRESTVPAAETALRRETLAIRAAADGSDGREGVRAFLEKRPPAFAQPGAPAEATGGQPTANS